MRRYALAGPLLASALLAAGCSGAEKETEKPPNEVLAAAKQQLDTTSGVQLTLASTNVPKNANGVTAANGTGMVNPGPGFTGTINATLRGVTGTIDAIGLGKQTWIKFFTPDYQAFDPGTVGAPNPAMLFDKTDGISSLLPATTEVAKGKQARLREAVLQEYSGKLPGSAINKVLVFGEKDGSFDVTYGIEPATSRLRTAKMTGPFFAGTTSTFTLQIDDYGTKVDITKP
ncbi:LppX_LprAFG lipoprotein [Actinomycetota bacterium]